MLFTIDWDRLKTALVSRCTSGILRAVTAAEPKIAYKVIDRSILLPYYRRWLVDPLLPFIPARVHPNTITHLGHIANLLGTALLLWVGASSGWTFVVAAICLQIYLWCDNADGSHARRTGQTSVYGEFLDHGLDQLNTAYIGYLTATALGADPAWWVAISLMTPGAAVLTYWEQSVTGIFRLGLLNQVESLLLLSAALVAAGIFGTEIFEAVHLGPVSLRLALFLWTTTTILFGIGRQLLRGYAAAGPKPLLPIATYCALCGLVLFGFMQGALDKVPAVAAATALAVYYGMHMLAQRMRGEVPRLTLVLILAIVPLGLAVASPQAGFANLSALAIAGMFGAFAVVETGRGLRRLAELGALLLILGALLSPKAAQAACEARASLGTRLGPASERPFSVSALSPKKPLVELSYEEAKGARFLSDGERVCPFRFEALELFAPPGGPAAVEEAVRLFSADALVHYPWPLARAIAREGGTLELKPGLSVGIDIARPAAGRTKVVYFTALITGDRAELLRHELSWPKVGLPKDSQRSIARWSAPELSPAVEPSGPGLSKLSPESRAALEERVERLRAAFAAANTLTPSGDAPAARAANDLGYQAIKGRQLEKAVEQLRRAVAADPSYGQAHYNLACALSLARSAGLACALDATKRRALEALEQTMKLLPTKRAKLLADRDLSGVRDTFGFGLIAGDSVGTSAGTRRLLVRVQWFGPAAGAFGPSGGLRFFADGRYERWSLVVPDDGAPSRTTSQGRFELNGRRVRLIPARGAPAQAELSPAGLLSFEDGTRFSDDADECSA